MPVSPQNDQKLIQQIDQLLGTKSIPASAGKAEKTESQAVAFFIGCANEGLIPESTRRLTELLEYLGCEIQYLKNQGCCGALADHTGRPGKAALLKRANSQSMEFLPEGLPVLVEAAGCGLQLKEYGPSVSEKIVDAAVFLSTLSISGLREIPLTVAYHDPCHGRHGQGIYSEPRKLLQQIPGLKLVEAQESEMCCGSGGAWGLHHQEMSDELGKHKARNLAATGADLVVTSNPGCLGQVADGLLSEGIPVPVLALTDLLWYAFFTAEKKN